jgi:hypothetical protein
VPGRRGQNGKCVAMFKYSAGDVLPHLHPFD